MGEQAEAVRRLTDQGATESLRRVRVLPQDVANQIAAGEVVERPASVVKELIENSLDAGATRILVELEGAGTDLIAVVDDGEGMGPEDAVTAFARHATSKVSEASDLERISTMGFRGEALASIAAVSRTTLVTRPTAALAGTKLVIDAGHVVDVRETGTPAGTRIEVANLFGNTPARRKFLKAAATEVSHVSELITRTALAWPQVSFTLRSSGRTLIELPGVKDPADRIRQVYGDERFASMMSFSERGAAGAIFGWLSHTHLTFPTARHIYTYVNRRYVRDKLISHALTAGYSTLLMHGRYPAAAVFLDIPLDEVDVNVHPAKSEVRFQRGGAVHELISRGVQSRLRSQQRDPAVGAESPDVAASVAAQLGMYWARNPGPRTLHLVARPESSTVGSLGVPLHGHPEGGASAFAPVFPYSQPPTMPGASFRPFDATPTPSSRQSAPGEGFFSSLRVLGQVFSGYLVCEAEESLVLIDQHAAHERVMFEGLRAAYGTRTMARQRMLVPLMVEVGAREATLLAERIDELEAIGFEIDGFGGTTFSVRAVPALLSDQDPAVLLRDVAEELVEVGRSRKVEEAAESVLARLACHSAIRVGQNLGSQQVQALLKSMDHIDLAGNCPHGRPAFIRVPRADLERWFRRT